MDGKSWAGTVEDDHPLYLSFYSKPMQYGSKNMYPAFAIERLKAQLYGVSSGWQLDFSVVPVLLADATPHNITGCHGPTNTWQTMAKHGGDSRI